MDKNYKKIIIILIAIIAILSAFLIKHIVHKKEINELLKEEDLSKVYSTNIILSNNGLENDKSNKVKKHSEKVGKKTKECKDFIAESKAINNKDKAQNENDILMNPNVAQGSNEQIELLARLIYSEAGNEPYLGKVAVGNVVLNRIRENSISMEDVIFDKNQFDGVNTNSFNQTPNQESLNAAMEVLAGTEAIEGGYFFANLNLCNPSWAKQKTFICRIGDHWFFKKE